MTTPGAFSNPVLETSAIKDEKIRLAYEEGHDADIPSNEGVVDHKSDDDIEKGQPASTSTATEETDTADIGATTADSNLVWWDEPVDQDPKNPMNWTMKKKWMNIFVLSWLTFIT